MRPTDAAEVVADDGRGLPACGGEGGLDIALHVPGLLGQAGPTNEDPSTVPAGLAVRPRPSLPPVAADPDRLAQMVANLIENACTFARTRVTIGLTDDGPNERVRHHRRRRRPGHRAERPRACLRALLPKPTAAGTGSWARGWD